MWNDYNDNEFEKYLQDQSAKYRMFPSDKIWKNIDRQLHGKRRWPGLLLFTLFIIISLATLTILLDTDKNKFLTLAKTQQEKELVTANSTNSNANTGLPVAGKTKPIDKQNTYSVNPSNHFTQALVNVNNASQDEVINNENIAIQPLYNDFADASTVIDLTDKKLSGNKILAFNNFIKPATGKPSPFKSSNISLNPDAEINAENKNIPLSLPKNKTKWSFSFYATPSISYRRLIEEVYDKNTGEIISRNSKNINNRINQRPAAGFEIGFATRYAVNEQLRVTAGVQMNHRKYEIPAYVNAPRMTTVDLVNNSGIETMVAFSSYSVQSGNSQTTLINKFYQLSVPVGIELSVIQNKRLGIAVAANVQPTMNIDQSSFILSADQKTYVDGNPLFRKFNINSSIGAQLTYKAGNVTWHLGPQFRYQHLPTYKTPYPLKEYLVDYGVKIGFSKSF